MMTVSQEPRGEAWQSIELKVGSKIFREIGIFFLIDGLVVGTSREFKEDLENYID
jgi:hypothetical protein